MRLRALALAALALLALAACGGGGNGISVRGLNMLVLKPSDLPSAFVRFDEGAQARADAVPGPRADPDRFGRQGGWKARYRRSGSLATAGPLVVESRADLFRSRGGAGKDLAAYGRQFEALADSGVGARPLKAPPLGDDVRAVTFRQETGATPVHFYIVAWRRRNASASVTVEGFEGRVTLRDALALARKQDRRIARAS